MIKCVACGKDIEGRGKLISCDGDFVCDDQCHEKFKQEMDRISSMSDEDFESWKRGEKE